MLTLIVIILPLLPHRFESIDLQTHFLVGFLTCESHCQWCMSVCSCSRLVSVHRFGGGSNQLTSRPVVIVWLASYPYPSLRLRESRHSSVRRLRFLPHHPVLLARCEESGVRLSDSKKFTDAKPVRTLAVLELVPGSCKPGHQPNTSDSPTNRIFDRAGALGLESNFWATYRGRRTTHTHTHIDF